METLAYLHHALAYEEAVITEPVPVDRLKNGLNWKKLSGPARTCFLSLSLAISVLVVSSQAWAVQQGAKGSQVTAIQQQLRNRGFFKQRPTGKFGPATRDAVIRFQQSQGLTSDGIVGPATEAALFGRARQASRQNYSYSGYRNSGYSGALQIGNRGPEVRSLQERLQQQGFYSGPIDGVFGPRTEQAVRQFQIARGGLNPDGVAGPETLNSLRIYNPTGFSYPTSPPTYSYASGSNIPISSSAGLPLENNRTLQQGDSGPEVSRLQERLRDRGFYYGPIDGNFGVGTEQAVRNYQRSKGIVVDGVAGSETLGALGLPGNNKKRYVVVVPIRGADTLDKVLQYEPRAYPADSRLGTYVNAGEYPDRLDAEAQSRSLRSHQLDARVVYR